MDLHDYADVAENYDLYLNGVGGNSTGFEDYYLLLAQKYGTQGIIDIACGTGALTLPLAKAGYEVEATDISSAMIEVTNQKLAKENLNVKTFTSDMTELQTSRKYSLAIIARSGFMHLPTEEIQKKALLSIRDCLIDGGVLTFNTFEPYFPTQLTQIHTGKEDYSMRCEYINKDGCREKIFNAINYNPETQIMSGNWKFETLDDNDNVIDVRIRPLTMRQSYKIQIWYLVEKCGYEVIEANIQPCCNNNIIWILKKI